MQEGVTKIIINSQVSAEGQSEDLKALAKLMNNEPVNLNKHFDYAQRRIKRNQRRSGNEGEDYALRNKNART